MNTRLDHQIYEGDCLQVMDELIELGIRVDLILTDIPYGTTANFWDSVVPLSEMWVRLNKIKRDKFVPILLFADDPFAAYLQISNEKDYRYKWYWQKNAPVGFLNSAWQPLKVLEQILVFIETPYQSSPTQESWKKHDLISQFYPQYFKGNPNHGVGTKLQTYTTPSYGKFKTQNEMESEYIKSLPNGLGTNYGAPEDKVNSVRNRLVSINPKFNQFRTDLKGKGEFDKHPINLIQFQKPKRTNMHPTEKPVDLLEYLVKTYTKEGQIVLDFTAGSGSLMEACLNTNRKSISIEIDPKYIAMITQRYEKLHWLKELEKD